MIRHLIYSLVVVFCLAMPLNADGLSYGDNQVFSHSYVDFEQVGALALVDYPFAVTGKSLTFQTSYRQLYNIRELTDNRAAIALTRGVYNVGLALASFGEPDYFHQTGLASFASYHHHEITVGASLIYSRVSFSSIYDYFSAYTANIGASYRRNRLLVFMVTRAVNQPRYYTSDEPLRPEAEIGLSIKTGEGVDSQVKALFVKYQKPTAELSQSFRPTDYAQINWSLVLLPVRFGGGVHLIRGHFGFEYKFSHHPVLGPTHTVLLEVFK